MHQLIFATNNKNKVEEIRNVIVGMFRVVSLSEAGINIDIPEPHETLEKNASEKSWTIHRLTGENCFSEDTGLEVLELNGEPGVKSARYAGEEKSDEDNVKKLLLALNGTENREARFRTVMSLILNGQEFLFSGICKGYIAEEPKGNKGFGYDSVFIPAGASQTFGEMGLEDKNVFSHRKKATDKLLAFLFHNGKEKFQ